MGVTYNPKIPKPESLFNLIDAVNGKHTSGSGNINDAINGIVWTRGGTVTDTIEDGIPCFNMDNGSLSTSATGLFGQYYTCFYLWKPRETDTGWRTLHRNDNDHIGIVINGGKSLGMYSNRNGSFRDSGYDITINWQTLILTGVGDTPTASTGTTTFYVNGVNVGTADRVGSGTDLQFIGLNSQGPGKIAVAGSYNRLLSPNEIQELHNTLYARIVN